MKRKAESILKWAKIVMAILSSSVLLMAFFLFRAYRRIVNLTKLIKNVTNYDDVIKRIEKLEKAK